MKEEDTPLKAVINLFAIKRRKVVRRRKTKQGTVSGHSKSCSIEPEMNAMIIIVAQ